MVIRNRSTAGLLRDGSESTSPSGLLSGPKPLAGQRPRVDGKFFFAGAEKLYLRGVTYGTFAATTPNDDGYEPVVTERDFASMAASGINAVRLYTVPPTWLLDSALRHGLWVMAGIPWSQHVSFLDSRQTQRDIEQVIGRGTRAMKGHPALLGLLVGNEIPAPIVRWHGPKRVERFIDRLCDIAHDADPDALVSYVNYPSTEYLELTQLDFGAFNVYIENAEPFSVYVDHLQTVIGDLPLVMAEIGLDSRRNGETAQAQLVERQIRATFDGGAAGAFVFAWTDDWSRSGIEVRDWDFGLTTRDRRPKASLAAVTDAYTRPVFPESPDWPRISVVVCSYNGERTIERCLSAVTTLAYPNYEVIVVDDGSTDRTNAIASGYPVRLIRTANNGLSAARNEGLAAATGEIVAYIDDDAWPDRDWLSYLAMTYRTSDHVGVGGPNVPPREQTRIEQRVGRAPGGPIHVLRDGTEAEHIPGCNCSFRVDALRAIGGFDPSFRVAGDDVDVCWRLQQRGWTLGFAPAAMVWHRRRGSVRAYLRQQRGYGAAEALLEKKWPSRFNALGHVSWPSQLYGSRSGAWQRARPFHGTWGSAEFQSLYSRSASWSAFPLMPEWFLLLTALAVLGLLGLTWTPLLIAWPLLVAASSMSLLVAATAARRSGRRRHSWSDALGVTETIFLTALHLAQPLVRLAGRLDRGLTPWRRLPGRVSFLPRQARLELWSEEWRSLETRLREVERRAALSGVACNSGGPFDRWDLEIRAGTLASARVLATAEEHGLGRQLIRFRIWPRVSVTTLATMVSFGSLSVAAFAQEAVLVAASLAAIPFLIGLRALTDAATSIASARAAVTA